VEHRDLYTADRKSFLGRIEPGDGAWEYMLGWTGGDRYDVLVADRYGHGHVDTEKNEYVTAVHEDNDCRWYGVVTPPKTDTVEAS